MHYMGLKESGRLPNILRDLPAGLWRTLGDCQPHLGCSEMRLRVLGIRKRCLGRSKLAQRPLGLPTKHLEGPKDAFGAACAEFRVFPNTGLWEVFVVFSQRSQLGSWIRVVGEGGRSGGEAMFLGDPLLPFRERLKS